MGRLLLVALLVVVVAMLGVWRRTFLRCEEKPDDLRRADDEPPKEPPSAMKHWAGKF
jgi:hypothetical protein